MAQSTSNYEFRFYTPAGHYLFSIPHDSIYSANFWIRERDVGTLTLDLPLNIGVEIENMLEYDSVIEVYRDYRGSKNLVLDKRWIIGLWRSKIDEGGVRNFRIRALDCNTWITRRVVYYDPDTPQTKVVNTPTDDAIKKIARENFGNLAQPYRDWSKYITIEPNTGLAKKVSLSGFSRINALTVMNNLCDLAYAENDEYVTFDMRWDAGIGKYIFRTYLGQMGANRGVNGNSTFYLTHTDDTNPLSYGGLSYASVENNGINRRTAVYCGGANSDVEEEGRVIAEVFDHDLINASPFGLWEDWEDARNSGNSEEGIRKVAMERLEKWSPTVAVNGHINAATIQGFGTDFNVGDIVAFKFRDVVRDVHIDSVAFDISNNGEEKITIDTRNMEESYY
ncbi:MAG: hypothetical protein GX139_13420 [Armatimonadetes bacterium]|nr:hypothetical protein [Armatimonadota bacterium]